MLANLYKKAGQERPSVTSYKEVLRQCPLALDAILGTKHSLPIFMECLLSKVVLLNLGYTLDRIAFFFLRSFPCLTCREWFIDYHCHVFHRLRNIMFILSYYIFFPISTYKFQFFQKEPEEDVNVNWPQ